MTYFATKRLTLTKSEAAIKPTLEADEPFPSLAAYPDAEMKRLEAEGLVYQAPKNADDDVKADRAKKAKAKIEPTAGEAGETP